MAVLFKYVENQLVSDYRPAKTFSTDSENHSKHPPSIPAHAEHNK